MNQIICGAGFAHAQKRSFSRFRLGIVHLVVVRLRLLINKISFSGIQLSVSSLCISETYF